jgi:AcrR family transcriptional regulator
MKNRFMGEFFMNDKSEDRRVRKTEKALRESLAILMAQKNIRNISVQELSDLADLNRATFYLHYRDIYELQERIEEDAAKEINAILDAHIPVASSSKNPYPLFVALLGYINENAGLCEMLLSENNNKSFLDKLCKIVEDRCLHFWFENHRFTDAEEELSYFSSFIVYGFGAAITKWVRTGMKYSPEKFAEIMGNMGLYGLGFMG